MPGLISNLSVDATPITEAAQDVLDAIGTLGSMKRATGAGVYLIPAGPSGGTVVASAAASHTYGSWVELMASAASDMVIIAALVYPVTSPTVTLNLGVGAAAAEVSVAALECAGATPVQLTTPIAIAAGERVAARSSDSSGNARNHSVILFAVDVDDLENF